MVDIKGKVTYKGKPLPGGTVVFQTADGKQRGVGPIMSDGSYSMKSPFGEVQAAVVTRTPTSEDMKGDKRPAVREVHMPANVPPSALPPRKYERFDTSGLTFEVKESGQTINIPLAD